MNLLYLLPFFPYLYTPWLYREMAWMRRRGHRIAIVSLGPPPGPAANLEDFGLADVPVLQVRRQYSGDGRLLRDLARLAARGLTAPAPLALRARLAAAGKRQGLHEWVAAKRVAAFARHHRTEVVEVHWASEAADMARLLKVALNLPFAVRLHGGDLYRSPSPSLPDIVRDAAAVCPVSAFLQSLLLGQRPVASLPRVPACAVDPAKLRICHNGLPAEAFAAEPPAQSEQVQRIGTIGRLDPEKRHADLVEAVARLAPRFPGLRLRIIGGGALEEPLRRQLAERAVTERVEITGSLPWEKVMEAVRQCHLYAQASEVEGCSLAVLEGAAQGLPLVMSRTGANEQCIEPGGNGWLYDAGDVPELCRRLEAVLSAGPEARQRMGRASLELIRRRFLFDTLMPRLEAILLAVRDGRTLPA